MCPPQLPNLVKELYCPCSVSLLLWILLLQGRKLKTSRPVAIRPFESCCTIKYVNDNFYESSSIALLESNWFCLPFACNVSHPGWLWTNYCPQRPNWRLGCSCRWVNISLIFYVPPCVLEAPISTSVTLLWLGSWSDLPLGYFAPCWFLFVRTSHSGP